MQEACNLFDMDSEPPVSVQEQGTDATRVSDLTDPLLEQAEESGPSWEENNEAVQETPTRDPLDEMAQEISRNGGMVCTWSRILFGSQANTISLLFLVV